MSGAAADRKAASRLDAAWWVQPNARLALNALLLAVGCYFGSEINSALRFPQIGAAILFPPYAILTAALLLSPARYWWVYLLAASLGSLVPHLRDGPASWVLGTEAANYTRALVAAVGVRYLAGRPPRFDTLRGVVAFVVVGVLLAPFLAAFVGAGVVILHKGTADYWLVWQAWFLSNALTGLTLLPLLLLAIGSASARTGPATPIRVAEAGLLSVGLLAVGLLVFAGPYAGSSHLPARLAAPLPFLLWAAVRFGPGGTSASLLLMSGLAIAGALRGQGPFTTQSPDQDLLSLQLFLIVVSVPLLILATAIEERKQALAALGASEQKSQNQLAQLSAIYRTAPIGLVFFDADLRYVSINDRLAEMNGLPASAHLGRTPREVLPELADQLDPLLRRVVASGTPVLDWEIRGTTAAQPDVPRDWIASYYPVKDAEGAIVGVNTVVQEITERKRAEEERQRLLRELGNRVNQLTALHDAARILQQEQEPAEWLRQIVALLPPAWQYPEVASARVCVGKLEVVTPGFSWTPWRQRAEFVLADGSHGAIEVVYREERPREQEGPFLADERSLIESLAEMFRCAIDREHAVKALLESEDRYRAVVQSQHDLICRYLPDTTLTFVNDAYCRFFGKTRDELIGTSFLQLIPEPARDPTRRHVESLQANPRVVVYEHEVVLPDGRIGWQEWTDHAILNSDGNVVGFQGIGRDTTERRLAEAALRESEARFRTMADAAPAMLWISGEDARATYLNRSWLEFTGRTLEQELGNGWAEGVHPEDLQRCLTTYMTAFNAGKSFRMEYRLRRADGQYRWILDTGVPLSTPAGALTGYIGSAIDITERKEAEESLRASEARYRALVTASAQAVWRCDARGIGIEEFAAWQELTGQSAPEMEDFGWTSKVHPDDRARAAEAWEHALRTGEPYEDEFRIQARDGTFRDFHVRGVPIRGADGRVCEWIGADTDVTEQKRAAEALRQARAELAHASRVMTVGELAASIAHEVNQPLAALVANAAACRRLLAAPALDLQEFQAAVEEIARDGTRASEVIARIRSLLKRGPAARERLDLNGLIREVVTLMQSEVRSRHVAVQMDLAAELGPVEGDRVQLQQVVLNLLLNALEAMNGNAEEPRELWVGSREAERGWVEVQVKDTGVGLGTAEVERLFEAFYTTKAEGMGMGLAITRRIVEGHGGRLWATPDPDRGVTFHFLLPSNCDSEPGGHTLLPRKEPEPRR